MGVRIATGQIYSCPNCKQILKKRNYISMLLFPIKFDYKIKKCSNCNNKYTEDNLEFFSISSDSFIPLLLFNLICWGILNAILTSWIISMFNLDEAFFFVSFAIFVPIHICLFIYIWKKEISISVKRIDNSEYLIDLVNANILSLDNIKDFYNKGLVSEKNYKSVVLMHNITDILKKEEIIHSDL